LGEVSRGRVETAGSERIPICNDGIAEITNLLTLKANDGGSICMTYRNLPDGPVAISARPTLSEQISKAECFFPTAPLFGARSEMHDLTNAYV